MRANYFKKKRKEHFVVSFFKSVLISEKLEGFYEKYLILSFFVDASLTIFRKNLTDNEKEVVSIL